MVLQLQQAPRVYVPGQVDQFAPKPLGLPDNARGLVPSLQFEVDLLRTLQDGFEDIHLSMTIEGIVSRATGAMGNKPG